MGKVPESIVCDICQKKIWGNQRWDYEFDLTVRKVYMLHFKRNEVTTYDICWECKSEMVDEVRKRLDAKELTPVIEPKGETK